jgi:hypothetical protein
MVAVCKLEELEELAQAGGLERVRKLALLRWLVLLRWVWGTGNPHPQGARTRTRADMCTPSTIKGAHQIPYSRLIRPACSLAGSAHQSS